MMDLPCRWGRVLDPIEHRENAAFGRAAIDRQHSMPADAISPLLFPRVGLAWKIKSPDAVGDERLDQFGSEVCGRAQCPGIRAVAGLEVRVAAVPQVSEVVRDRNAVEFEH